MSRKHTARGEGWYRRAAKAVGIPKGVVEESALFARRSEVKGDTGLGLATDKEEQAARMLRDLPLPSATEQSRVKPPEKES